MFRSTLSLIMRIVKEKNKHGQHWSEKPVIGPTLNPNKILHKQFLIKKFGIHIHKSMNFKYLKKIKLVAFLQLKWYAEDLREKTIHFQNKRAHNLETLGSTHKKNPTLLETWLLKNYGKLSSLSPKSLYQKCSNWKTQTCCQRGSIIRPCW